MKKKGKKASSILALLLAFTMVANFAPAAVVKAAFNGALTKVDSAEVKTIEGKANVVEISYNDGAVKGRITLLEDGIFRFNVDPTGQFAEYATPYNQNHKATIQAQSDTSTKYSRPKATVNDADGKIEVKAENGTTAIVLDKATAKMSVKAGDKTVMSEKEALSIGEASTVQTLDAGADEYFFGGGTQNGRFTHKGEFINIRCESGWTDGGVASPNPFYWSSDGYGVLRNTFAPGGYDFGREDIRTVSTTHNENEFDAYYFVTDKTNISEKAEALLQDYYKVTGNPALLPEYAFYLAHLNAYNRDYYQEVESGGWLLEDGKRYWEKNPNLSNNDIRPVPENALTESLNNEKATFKADNFKGTIDGKQKGEDSETYKFSARAVIDGYVDNDMPIGWFLPNDGYGAGYGQNGYMVPTADATTEEMDEVVDANVQNLKDFTDYAESYGIRTALWTQSSLTVADSRSQGYMHLLRDFKKEVLDGGVSALKTDVAWVGSGYSMALDAQRQGHDIVAQEAKKRPAVVSVDGWAGTQRYAGLWTGDQTGGNWEYIRFHIPTYIGQSLSGNPNVGSDVDGIYGGSDLVMTRDLQFKTFTTIMMDMDGWGNIPKKPYIGGDPYESINRMYLKLKAQLMPYLYTEAIDAVDGLPMIRAMFLEEPSEYTYSKATQYQFMYGDNFLVAPVYQDTEMKDNGDDIRNNIYLPGTSDVWIDYFTGKQYRGGQIVNHFDAPLWKMPLFVKNGSIIPMYEDNNNPMEVSETNVKGLDKSKRIIEFYPYGNTSYTLKEDDGISLTETDEKRDYGGTVTTEITSKVENGTATLTAGKSTGSYKNYKNNRHTTFVVNVSKDPGKENVTATNGSQTVELEKVDSYEAFQAKAKAGAGAYFYDAAPNLNKYCQEGEAFAATKITTTPKLYVSFTNTNVDQNEQKLVIKNFENIDPGLGKDERTDKLEAPKNLKVLENSLTSTSITLTWDKVDGATGYDLQIDGKVTTVGNITSHTHESLEYNSRHKYKVRARSADGYSAWSSEVSATSLEDPWGDVLTPKTITWEGGDQFGALKNATDHNFQTMFHSAANATEKWFVMDFGSIYDLASFTYYPRGEGNSGDGTVGVTNNGTVQRMTVQISRDGETWETMHDGTAGEAWTYTKGTSIEESGKKVDLNGKQARYVALYVHESVGDFFAANELIVEKVHVNVVDNSELQDRYDKYARRLAEEGFKDHYTAESWDAYAKAMDDAKSLLSDQNATQEQIDAAYNGLKDLHGKLTPKVSADTFTDVTADWMKEHVANAYHEKLMTGKETTLFEPGKPINRAEVAIVINRMAGSPKEDKAAKFTDLKEDWYKNAVNWANNAKKGTMEKPIVTGYSDTEFRPAQAITRQEIAMMLYRYAQYMGYDTSTEEDPNAKVHWADLYDEKDKPWPDGEPAMKWCVAKGLIEGNEKNGKLTLDPFGTAYRVQAAAIFYRFVEKFEN